MLRDDCRCRDPVVACHYHIFHCLVRGLCIYSPDHHARHRHCIVPWKDFLSRINICMLELDEPRSRESSKSDLAREGANRRRTFAAEPGKFLLKVKVQHTEELRKPSLLTLNLSPSFIRYSIRPVVATPKISRRLGTPV